jgi:hypothetical protein
MGSMWVEEACVDRAWICVHMPPDGIPHQSKFIFCSLSADNMTLFKEGASDTRILICSKQICSSSLSAVSMAALSEDMLDIRTPHLICSSSLSACSKASI